MLVSQLPNLFDQYSQYENRVTNALLQTLASSPSLARSFLQEFVGIQHDPRRELLIIATQKRPGARGDRGGTGEAETERETVPDGLLICEETAWAVVLESKIERGNLRLEQLRGHLRGAAAYPRKYLLILTPDDEPPREVWTLARHQPQVRWHSWSEVHRWATRALNSQDDRQASGHLLRNLKGFLEMDERLSDFQGFDFRDGYEPRKAKALLKALMDQIRPEVLKIYPELTGGRPGITTFGTGLWDCFGVEPRFTDDLHLTLSVNESETIIGVTVPNAAKERWRRLRFILDDPALFARFQRTIESIRKDVPELWIRLDQRHFIAQKHAVPDAQLDFKIDTADFMPSSRLVKRFPLWFKVAREAVLIKRGINLQLSFRARFNQDQVPELRSPHFAETALRTLKSFRPLYRLLRD